MGNGMSGSGIATRPRVPRSKSGESLRRICQLSITGIVYIVVGFQLACFLYGYGSAGRAGGGLDIAAVERRLMSRLESLAKGQGSQVAGGSAGGGQDIGGVERRLISQLESLVKGQGLQTAGGAAIGGESGTPGGAAATEGSAGVPSRNTTTSACLPQTLDRTEGNVMWRPKQDRYLLAMCSGGQLSNRLACFRQHMLDAALLNRTLIIPTTGIDYNYDNLLDIGAMKACFPNQVIMTLDEYRKTLAPGVEVRVGRFVCHVHEYQTDEVCEQLVTRYTVNLGISFGKRDIAPRKPPSPWFKYPSGDLVRKFRSDHHVVAFGNMFGIGGRELKFHGAKPLAVTSMCRGLIQPSRAIQETAAGFIDAYLGTRFVGVHMRRGDFFGHCLKAPERRHACYHPIHQVARCLAARVAAHPDASMLFLATNADKLEVDTLRDGLSYQGRAIPIVQLPKLAGQPWAEPLVKKGLADNAEVLSFVDKVVCANSRVFFGTWGSTFTHDIFRLRDWWNQATTCDSFFCDPEEAADIIPLVEPKEAPAPPAVLASSSA